MSKRLLIPLALTVAVVSGCVTVPTGPGVMVLPGSRKTLEQFRIDEADCRNYAQAVLGGPYAAQPANDAAAANAAVGTAIGAAAGAIIGAASGQAGAGAAIGAGTGLLFGSASGSNYSGYSQYQLQQSYDIAYMQCMYTRGNQIPGRVAYRGAAPSYNYPPPDYPAPGASSGGYPAPPGAASGNYPPPNYPPPTPQPPRM